MTGETEVGSMAHLARIPSVGCSVVSGLGQCDSSAVMILFDRRLMALAVVYLAPTFNAWRDG